MAQTFTKSERLCRKKLFDDIFSSGKTFIKYPFRVVWKISSDESENPFRVAVSVSKKKFKQAVKRNRIKRLAKESFRINKNILSQEESYGPTVDVLFIFIGDSLPEYSKVDKAIKNSLEYILSQKLHDR